MDNTNNIMIYRDTKLDKKYALRRILGQSKRVLAHYSYKALCGIVWGIDELVIAANPKKK